MDFSDVFSSFGAIIVLIIMLVFSIYLWSLLMMYIYKIMVFLLKAVYVLALIGAILLGTGYVLYSILLFLDGRPVNMIFVLASLFFVYLGGMGMINIFREITKPLQTTSNPQPTYPRYPHVAKNTYGYHPDPLREEVEEEERERIGWQKELADIDARIAKDRADTREVEDRNAEWANIQIERREAAEAYNQQQWDNWQQQQDEREEYSRQQREKWSQQDE